MSLAVTVAVAAAALSVVPSARSAQLFLLPDTPLGAHATNLYERLVAAGDGQRDFSAIFRWLAAQERDKLI